MNVKRIPKLLKITNCTVLDPYAGKQYAGEILLKNGKIEKVGQRVAAKSAETFDAGGKVVSHGFLDIHAHFREPGREDKETLASGADAAVAGGFTQVCVMPNTDPPIDSPESVRFVKEKSADLLVDINPIGAVTMGQKGEELTEMSAMHDEGAVAFSDDGIPIMDSGVLRRALEYSGPLGVPIINHAEDLALKLDGQIHEGEWSTRLGLAGVPDVSESSMVARDIQLMEFTAGKLHVPHVSSRKSVEWIAGAKHNGLRVTAEVTPHHLYFTDADIHTYDTNLKVAPPIRSASDRLALVEAVKDGTIDCIATDHAPHTVEEKEAPFDWAPNGMIGLESAFGAAWRILSEAGCDLMHVVRLLTSAPRQIMGFETDLFAAGQPAQLTILDPNEEWTFSTELIYSKSRNSPFVGRKLRGRISTVITDGKMCIL